MCTRESISAELGFWIHKFLPSFRFRTSFHARPLVYDLNELLPLLYDNNMIINFRIVRKSRLYLRNIVEQVNYDYFTNKKTWQPDMTSCNTTIILTDEESRRIRRQNPIIRQAVSCTPLLTCTVVVPFPVDVAANDNICPLVAARPFL